jgi:DNA-directed RNA polymerase specialized sigma24 family protein
MALTRAEEKALILKLKASSAASDAIWETLHSEYDRAILRYAAHATRNAEDARDIAQQAWIRLWDYRAKFDPGKNSVPGFLRLLVARAAASRYRPERVIVSIDDDGDDNSTRPLKDILSGKQLSPEELTELRQLYFLILKTLSELGNPMHQKLAFGFLRFLEEESGRIVSEFSPQTLAVMEMAFEAKFPGAPCRDTDKAFQAFRKSLNDPVDWEHVQAAHAGSTRFGIYFEVQSEEARRQKVQAWADTIRKKIIFRLATILPEERTQKGVEK